MLACGVRAPRRAGWCRSMPYESPLLQRDGPLPRCTAALRRASRGLQQAAFLRMCARKSATARALSLSGGGAARALAACARRAALVGVDSCPMEIHCASETARSLSARSCSDVPAAASNEQPALHVHARERATARFSSGGGAPRALAARAPRAALVGVGLYPWKPTAPAKSLFPLVHGRDSTCQPRPPTSSRRLSVRARERTTVRSLSGGGAPRALAA